jgi:hypothetical protein
MYMGLPSDDLAVARWRQDRLVQADLAEAERLNV